MAQHSDKYASLEPASPPEPPKIQQPKLPSAPKVPAVSRPPLPQPPTPSAPGTTSPVINKPTNQLPTAPTISTTLPVANIDAGSPNAFLEQYTKTAVIKSVGGGKYALMTADGKRRLGTHDSKQKAYKQEYAIQKSEERRSQRKKKAMIDLNQFAKAGYMDPTDPVSRSASGEAKNIGFKMKHDDHAQGQDAWDATTGYLKGSKKKDESSFDPRKNLGLLGKTGFVTPQQAEASAGAAQQALGYAPTPEPPQPMGAAPAPAPAAGGQAQPAPPPPPAPVPANPTGATQPVPNLPVTNAVTKTLTAMAKEASVIGTGARWLGWGTKGRGLAGRGSRAAGSGRAAGGRGTPPPGGGSAAGGRATPPPNTAAATPTPTPRPQVSNMPNLADAAVGGTLGYFTPGTMTNMAHPDGEGMSWSDPRRFIGAALGTAAGPQVRRRYGNLSPRTRRFTRNMGADSARGAGLGAWSGPLGSLGGGAGGLLTGALRSTPRGRLAMQRFKGTGAGRLLQRPQVAAPLATATGVGLGTTILGGDPSNVAKSTLAMAFKDDPGGFGEVAREHLGEQGAQQALIAANQIKDPAVRDAVQTVIMNGGDAGSLSPEQAEAAAGALLAQVGLDPQQAQSDIQGVREATQDPNMNSLAAGLEQAAGALEEAVVRSRSTGENLMAGIDQIFNTVIGATGLGDSPFGMYMAGLNPIMKAVIMASVIGLPFALLGGSKLGAAMSAMGVAVGLGSGLANQQNMQYLQYRAQQGLEGLQNAIGGAAGTDPAAGQTADVETDTNQQTVTEQNADAESIANANEAGNTAVR